MENSGKLKIDKVQIVLVSIIMAMSVFMGSMFYAYAKLNMALPLENLRTVVMVPVYEGQDLLEFKGTFDRSVSCTLQRFRIDFTNLSTNDMISLTEKHLAKAPVPDKGPGVGLKVNFALAMPTTMYAGRWQPIFHGAYLCKHGIFTAQKAANITADSFLVQLP